MIRMKVGNDLPNPLESFYYGYFVLSGTCQIVRLNYVAVSEMVNVFLADHIDLYGNTYNSHVCNNIHTKPSINLLIILKITKFLVMIHYRW